MTDAEVICEWMEPDAPKDGAGGARLEKFSPQGWFRYSMLSCLWKRPILVACNEVELLGRIRRVEERIVAAPAPNALKGRYVQELSERVGNGDLWFATAEQKIAALAAVIRRGA